MKTLVHICCGPCTVYPFKRLTEEGHEPTGYWYNPNIHPLKEYRARLDNLKQFNAGDGIAIIYDETYDIERYFAAVMRDFERRCLHCFELRLAQTAITARQRGFDSFCTTLLVSPYQKQDWLREVGYRLQYEHGVRFVDIDMTVGFRQGKQEAYEMGQYMQKYCGCVFSERDRFQKQK